jgi:hypothetical protein
MEIKIQKSIVHALPVLKTVLKILTFFIRIRILLCDFIRIRIRLFDTYPDPYRFKEEMFLKRYFLYI